MVLKEVKMWLSSIIFDETIYPRKTHNPTKVQEYAENLEAIEASGNFIHISSNNKLLDGRHRHLAYLKKYDGEDVEITVFLHEISERKDELLKAIELNSSHGQQLSQVDKKSCCLELYSMGFTTETIVIKVSVSKRFVNMATQRVREDEKRKRDEKIYEMFLSCHTTREIAEEVGVDYATTSRSVKSLLHSGTTSQLQQTYTNDKEFTPPLYNVWTFAKKSNSVSHFGNSEQRIVDNLLYLYTNPYDIVVDVFGGGGSTIDVCKKRARRYWVSDRKPIVERAHEIRLHDIKDGAPALNKRWSDVTLTYLDPPYWKQAEGQYSKDAEDLANMPLDKFTETLADFVKLIASKQSKGVIALIIQPTQWKADNKGFADHVVDLINAVGLPVVNRVSVPYSTEQYNAQQVNWAKENKRLLVISRELIIWSAKRG